MKKNINAVSASLLCSLITTPAAFALDISADIELDMLSEESVYSTGGRVQLNIASETRNGDNFVSSFAEANQLIDGTASVDDAWIKMGNSKWAFQVGRWESKNLLPLGKDTYIASTGVTGYQANTLRGRLGGNGIAFSAMISDAIAIEIDSAWGNYDGTNGDSEEAFNGFRPSLTYTGDGFGVVVGFEAIDVGTTDISGSAVSVNADIAGGVLNASFATADDAGTDRSSTAVNYTLGNFGAGVLSEDDGTNDGSSVYAAYTMSLLGVKGAAITVAASSGEDVSEVSRFDLITVSNKDFLPINS